MTVNEEKDRPEFSIIVPVYNAEKYIGRCLDSLLGQTLDNIEVIAVDDRSADGSLSVLKKYSEEDGRLKVIAREKNGSQLLARLDGLRAARGHYMLLVDSDDYIEKDTCSQLSSHLKDDPCDIVEFLYDHLPAGTVMPVNTDDTGYDLKKITRKMLRWEHPHIGCNKCYSFKVIQRFLEQVEEFYCNMSEDFYQTVLIFTLAENYSKIDKVFYHYVQGTGTSTVADGIVLNIDSYAESIRKKNYHLEKYLKENAPDLMEDFYISVRKEIGLMAAICVGSSHSAYEKIGALRTLDRIFGTNHTEKYENQHKKFDQFLNSGNLKRIKIAFGEVMRKIGERFRKPITDTDK